jgi:predicted TPR repeat methyltransferase
LSHAFKESRLNPDQIEAFMSDEACDSMLEQARAAQYAGKLDEAGQLYHRILRRLPLHPGACHGLGLLCHQRGQTEAGIDLIRQAISLSADRDDWYNALGNMLASVQRHEDAALAFLAALEIHAANPLVWNNLGAVLLRSGRLQEAGVAFENAIALDPGFEDAFNNLGTLQTRRAQPLCAARSFCQAYVLHPHPGKPKHMLGMAYYILGRIDQAAEIYRQWLQEEPDQPIAQHLLAACSGQNVPVRASNAYLENHFDHAAADFDQQLQGHLGYKIPELSGGALKELGVAPASLRVLDAGCGTGLCGPCLAPYASYLRGVDISGKSLALAAQKAVYHDLVQEEIVVHLAGCAGGFDLIVAADTLIYFGLLEPLLRAAAKALQANGLLIASAEQLQQSTADYSLNPNGRYSHGRDYLAATFALAGFELCAMVELALRTELGVPIPGWLLVARKRGACAPAECSST